MTKKIEKPVSDEVNEVKIAVDELLDNALTAARREEQEIVVFSLAKAKEIASEINYDIKDKIDEVLEITESWE